MALCYLLYKAKMLSVYLCTFWHADNLAVSIWIETRLSRNESCVFEDHSSFSQAYSTHHSSTGVPRRQRCKHPLICKAPMLKQLASSLSPTADVFCILAECFIHSMVPSVNIYFIVL